MTTDDQVKEQVPQEEKAFSELLKKYQVGLKGNMAETIAENISRTGGERVFEYPERLAERLTAWHEYISPVRRKQIIEHWFAEKGVEVPEEALRTAGLRTSEIREREEEEKARRDEEEKRKAKFFVDQETGQIRAAKEGEKALTWDEAERVADRMKKERSKVDREEKEPPFIQDSEGNWMLNPRARIGGLELLAFEAVRRSQERGEFQDPFEILKERAREVEVMRSVFGGGKETGGLSETVEALLKVKELTGGDEETKNLLAGIYNRLKEGAEGRGQSEEVKALREEVQTLRGELERKEKERLEDQIRQMNAELADLRAELARAASESSAKDEYGIMSEALKMADKRLGAIENVIVAGRPGAGAGGGDRGAGPGRRGARQAGRGCILQTVGGRDGAEEKERKGASKGDRAGSGGAAGDPRGPGEADQGVSSGNLPRLRAGRRGKEA